MQGWEPKCSIYYLLLIITYVLFTTYVLHIYVFTTHVRIILRTMYVRITIYFVRTSCGFNGLCSLCPLRFTDLCSVRPLKFIGLCSVCPLRFAAVCGVEVAANALSVLWV